MARSYYKSGAWNAICDRCGFEYKSAELKEEWTGLRVCSDCWESRHPQDLLRPPRTEASPSWVRPEPTDVFLSALDYILTEDGDIIYIETAAVGLQEES